MATKKTSAGKKQAPKKGNKAKKNGTSWKPGQSGNLGRIAKPQQAQNLLSVKNQDRISK